MLSRMFKRAVRRRMLRQVPLFKVLAIAEVGMLARRHLQNLTPAERRRLVELVRRGRGMPDADRAELRALTAKLDSRAFAGAAVDSLSPVPLPRRLTGVGRKRS